MDEARQNDQRSLKKRLVFFLKLAVSLGIIAWIFTWIPLAGVWEALRTAHLWALGGALAFWFGAHVLSARRTRLLTRHQGMSLRTMDIFRISAVTSFYKMALPGGVGGSLIRWYKMSRPDGKPIEAFNVMMYDRVINALVLILLGAAFMFVDRSFARHPFAWPAVAVLGMALVIHLGMYLVAFNGRLAGWVTRRIAPFLPMRIREPVCRLASCADHFNELGHALRIRIWAYAVTGRILNLLMYYLLIIAVGLPLGFATVAWVRTAVFLIVLIPVTFSGLGLREGAMLLLLTPYGVDPEHIVAFSMLVFIAILFHAGIGGAYEILDGLTRGRAGRVRRANP